MLFRVLVIALSMVLLIATAGTAPAADTPPQGGDAAAAGQPATVTVEVSGEAAEGVVKPKKVVKKEPPPEPEPLPGQKLTLKQVVNILKTTRNLSGRNLSGLKLIGMDLSKCNLKGADLRHADLERADLGESNLERADLSGANLKMANLRLSGMTGVNLDNTDLSGAIWKDSRVCAPASVGQCRETITPAP